MTRVLTGGVWGGSIRSSGSVSTTQERAHESGVGKRAPQSFFVGVPVLLGEHADGQTRISAIVCVTLSRLQERGDGAAQRSK